MVNVKKENKITKVIIAFPGMYNVESKQPPVCRVCPPLYAVITYG